MPLHRPGESCRGVMCVCVGPAWQVWGRAKRGAVGIQFVGFFPFGLPDSSWRWILWTDMRRLTGFGLAVADCLGSQDWAAGVSNPFGLGTGRGDLLADCSAVSDWVGACDVCSI